jgi:O-antigen/teichoic acid export membrane protein
LLITLLSGVALVPFYLSYITIGDYGAWLSSLSLINILFVVGGGLDITLTNLLSYHVAEGDKHSFSTKFTSFSMIGITSGVIILVVGFCLSFYLNPILNEKQLANGFRLSFCLYLGGFILNQLFTIVKCIPISLHHNFQIGLLEFSIKLVSIGILVFGLMHGWGLIAFGIQQLFSGLTQLLGGSIIAINVCKKTGYRISNFELKDVATQTKLVLPIFAGRSGSVLIQNMSLPLISNLMTTELAGKFSITNRLYDAMVMFLNPVGRSFFPSFSNFFATGKSAIENKFNLVSKLFLCLTIMSFFVICLANKLFVTLWVGESNYAGELLNFAFAVCGVIQVLNDYSGLGLIAIGQQMKTVWYGFIDLGLRIVLLYLFFTLGFGAVSVPLSQLLSIGFLTFYLFKRLYISSDVDLIFNDSFPLQKVVQFCFFCGILLVFDFYQFSWLVKLIFSIPILLYIIFSFNLISLIKALNIKV